MEDNGRPAEVKATHIARKAVVYVRQSSQFQVLNNTGSTAAQRDQIHYALRWGWPKERIEIIDDDLGLSGTTSFNRPGYLRMVAEIRANLIGAVFFSDDSRVNRDSTEFSLLLRDCERHDVLLVSDGRVSDVRDPNQRLVKQISGNVVEYENCLRGAAFKRGRLATVRAGRAVGQPPRGYVRGQVKGSWELDPEPRVRECVNAVFQTFPRCGSLLRTLAALLEAGVMLSRRHKDGRIEWRRPTVPMIQQMLNNPLYTGDYIYPQRCIDTSRERSPGGNWRFRPATSEEQIVVRAHHPAYISHEEWDDIQRLFKRNTCWNTQQVLGGGCALLQGILYCGVHGYRMNVGYGRPNQNGETYFAYRCVGRRFKGGEACIAIPGPLLDRAVEQTLLQWLRPPQLEVLDAEWKRAQANGHSEERLQRAELERARVAAEEAEARYQQVDLKNPLVKEKCETLWQEALAELARLELRASSEPVAVDPVFTEEAWNELLILATDITAIFNAPTTENRDRKEIVRTLADRGVVEKQSDDVICVTIRRADGEPDVRLEVKLVKYAYRMIAELAASGLEPAEIARRLNEEGLCTHKGQPWSERTVGRRIGT